MSISLLDIYGEYLIPVLELELLIKEVDEKWIN